MNKLFAFFLTVAGLFATVAPPAVFAAEVSAVAAAAATPEGSIVSAYEPGGSVDLHSVCSALDVPAVQCRGHLAHAIYWAGLCGLGLTAWGAAKKVFSILKEAKKLAKKKKVSWSEAITRMGKAAFGSCGLMFVTIGIFIECHFGADYAGDDTDDDIEEIWQEIEKLMEGASA